MKSNPLSPTPQALFDSARVTRLSAAELDCIVGGFQADDHVYTATSLPVHTLLTIRESQPLLSYSQIP